MQHAGGWLIHKLPFKAFSIATRPFSAFQRSQIERVIIDNLHLFLRVVDNLINLLILELQWRFYG